MVQVFISIGSNVDREQNIRSAVAALRERWGRLTLSPVYESAPVGFRGGNFYNLVAGLDTRTPVARLLDELAALERAHGRTRGADQFVSRTLDLDLLLYGDLILRVGSHPIPHPDIALYAFMLRPLSEIAPDVIHPQTSESLGTMWSHFAGKNQVLWPAPLNDL